MQRLVHNISINYKGSTGLCILAWSLFFFLAFLFSCHGNNEESKTSDELAIAVAEVRMMDSCRVTAHNREFYLHKYKAERIISKYSEKSSLTVEEEKLLTKAKSGLCFAYSDYLMQVGKYVEAYEVMQKLATNTSINLYNDTTQWLRFLCCQSKVHYVPYSIEKNKETILHGYDSAVQGYILASRLRNASYKGQFMQVLSMYFFNDSVFALVSNADRASIRYINDDAVPDSLLAGNLAERSLCVFLKLNDPYYTAKSWLALARCYFKINDARQSIQCLNSALANPAIDSMPDLRASICEQLSLAYAAVDNKHNSDFYRNEYLDLQDSTRQDRELEARVEALELSTSMLWEYVAITTCIFLFLCIITLVFVRTRRKKEKQSMEDSDEIDELRENLKSKQLQYSNTLRSAVEQRARISVITGMIPLIDRMAIAVEKHEYDYTRELADEIDRQNAMITRWVKIRKGIILPRIETFALNEILDVLRKKTTSLALHNIELNVSCEVDIEVKADRSLTLFILNTLIDNAKKAIVTHGTITVSCNKNINENYAEITVADTGKGMSEEKVERLFEYRTINDNGSVMQQSHGFGLVNCRGIIDRYRKVSSQFSVCTIHAESVLGSGTRISFRLPLVLKLLYLLLLLPFENISANSNKKEFSPKEVVAARYCDSLYKFNVEGRYEEAMLYADSCYTLVKGDSTVDVGIRLSLYNEIAVAALALHQWYKYAYFNYYYTRLYKEYTADATLPLYCQTMERNKYWANVAVAVMIVLLLSLLPIFWFVYLRHVVASRKNKLQIMQQLTEEANRVQIEQERLHIINNITDNQLSVLKHETMYYPVRVRQLASTGGTDEELKSTIEYYRELYKNLSLNAMNKLASTFSFKIEKLRLKDIFRNLQDNTTYETIWVTANKELIMYLNLLLRRHNGGKYPMCNVVHHDKSYVTLHFYMSMNPDLIKYSDVLFSTDTPNVDFLIMRQIIRETTNTSLRYAAGITAFVENNTVIIQIVLPLQ